MRGHRGSHRGVRLGPIRRSREGTRPAGDLASGPLRLPCRPAGHHLPRAVGGGDRTGRGHGPPVGAPLAPAPQASARGGAGALGAPARRLAIRTLMYEAAVHDGVDPDRLRFTGTLRVRRRAIPCAQPTVPSGSPFLPVAAEQTGHRAPPPLQPAGGQAQDEQLPPQAPTTVPRAPMASRRTSVRSNPASLTYWYCGRAEQFFCLRTWPTRHGWLPHAWLRRIGSGSLVS